MLVFITTRNGNPRCDFIPVNKVALYLNIVFRMGATIDSIISLKDY